MQRNGESYFARGRSDKREKASSSGRKDKERSRSGSGSRLKCWLCNKEGYMRKDCYARRKKYGDDEPGEAAVVVDQKDDALSVSDNRHGDEWILDSGCSYHMTTRRDWFDHFQELNTGQVLLGHNNAVAV